MLRVVFDTVVFVRALINPHSTWGRTVFQHSGDYRLFLSEPVLREILDVLQRPELMRKFRSLERLDLRRVLDVLGRAEAVDLPTVPKVARDPKDDVFLATALAARARYLVSEDQDLLVLGEYEGTQIVDTATFLRLVQDRSDLD